MLDEARKALGRNNVSGPAEVDGRTVFVKQYFRHAGDPRDRLGTEWSALVFLRANGVRCVPEPLAVDTEKGTAVYEYVEGKPLAEGEVTLDDGVQLIDLLAYMFRLRDAPGAAELPDASDAAFSLRAYLRRLDERMARTYAADPLVEREIAPGVAALRDWLESRAPELGVDLDEETSVRTLSPGDIGFHNAIRKADGSLVFVDFEYCGWDDAAHVIASACVPPGVTLPEAHHLDVLRSAVAAFGTGGNLAARVRLVYPLAAAKWSLILLNELTGVSRERRRYAGALEGISREKQIARARAQLDVAFAAIGRGSFLEELIA